MADAKVILKAQNDIKAGLENAKSDLNGFGDFANSIGKKVEAAFTFAAIFTTLKELGKAAFDCFQEFGEGERRIKQLKIALDNNESSLNKATSLIDEMRKISLSSKDDIESLVTELASLGKSDKEIDKITRASVNLSNITGKDLNTSFNLINGTYTGTLGKLEKLLPELGNLTTAQLQAGGAADAINTKFGEMSTKLAENDIPQKLKNLKDGLDQLRENAGERAAAIFNPLIEGLNKLVEGWNNAYEAQNRATKDLMGPVTLKNSIWMNKDNSAEISKNAASLSSTMTRSEYESVLAPMFDKKSWDTLTEYQRKNLQYARSLASQFQTSIPQAPGRVSTLVPIGSSGSKDDPAKEVKENYKTIESLVKALNEVISINENHPDYYSADKIKGLVQTFTSQIYSAETLKLGPEGAELLNTARNLLKNINSVGEEKNKVNTQTELPSSDSWSRHYQALGEKYNTDKILAAIENGEISLEGINKQYYEYLTKDAQRRRDIAEQEAAKSLNYKPNVSDEDDASNLAALDTIWTNKVLATIKDGEVNLDGINKQYYEYLTKDAQRRAETAKLMSVKFETSFKSIGVLGELQKITPTYNKEKADKAWSDNYTALAAKYNYDKLIAQIESGELILTGLNKQYYDYLVKDAQRRADEAQRISFLTNEVRGQSTTNPANSGTSIADQMIDLNNSKPSFFQNLIGDFKGVFTDLKSSFGSGFMDVIKGSGLSGGDILGSLNGMFGELAGALGPLTQIIFSANPVMAALLPVFEGFVSIIGPAISEVIEPLFTALKGVGESLGKALLPILDALAPIFSIIGMILTSAIAPILEMLSPIIEYIAMFIGEILVPVLKGLAIVFEVLTAPVKFLGDLFSWLGQWIKTLGENIGITIWNLTHWLDQKSYVEGPGKFVSDAFTGLAARIDAILNIGPTNMAEGTNVDTNTSTSVAGASYTGGNTITINIYQQAPVVGDGGMQELAKMIRNEFLALDYYNA